MAIAPGPTLETARLVLRPTAQADLDRWAELMADPVAARFIGGAQPRAVAWRGMASMAGSWALKRFGMFSVIDKASGLWLGRVGPWEPEGWPGTEIGWGLHPSAQGKGYAVEASEATIDWAFEHLGWTEVIHCIDPENTPSERVAQRLGATNRGPGQLPAPHEASKINIWGQTAAEWKNRPRPDQP
ncbi:GNAT family N-acetyltransferase [Caulobacter sp.]|jgi:RimJ/RimL family protein N-acetyltransferase|uniref:GNAT family N-acetyltransferase n=1 Tax=Caulobacter sp. TaxID=78 RepID=UPI00161FF3F4